LIQVKLAEYQTLLSKKLKLFCGRRQKPAGRILLTFVFSLLFVTMVLIPHMSEVEAASKVKVFVHISHPNLGLKKLASNVCVYTATENQQHCQVLDLSILPNPALIGPFTFDKGKIRDGDQITACWFSMVANNKVCKTQVRNQISGEEHIIITLINKGTPTRIAPNMPGSKTVNPPPL
jgi:hypothetical protein